MRWLAIIVLIATPWITRADDVPPSPDPTPATSGMTLDECIAWAQMRHPKLFEAGFQIDQARGDAFQAGLYPNPRIDSGNPQTIGPKGTTVLTTGLTQNVITA